MEPLRIGILGAARIAGAAIVTPARVTGARLVAVAARDRHRAEQFAAENGVERVLSSYDDLLADEEVEAVYNPLANGLHGPWNLAAIAAGKPVLSEKPFASNADEAREVRDAAQQAGVAAVEAFHYRYHPLTARLHEVLAAGELGKITRVEATMTIPAPAADDPRWSLPLAGGALMDLGCYSLHAHRDLAPFAGGEPALVSARGGERAGAPGVDEWLEAELEFPNGATGLARCNMAGEAVQMSARVTGSGGEAWLPNFVVPHLDDRLVITTPAGVRVEHLGPRTSWTYQLDAFSDLVREGTPMATNAADAVVTMGLIDACYGAIGLQPRPRSLRPT